MQLDRVLKTTIAILIFSLVWDYVAMNYLLASYYAGLPFLDLTGSFFGMWGLLGYVAAAFVWVLVYDKVRSNFAPTAGGGMMFGFYAGLLANFPVWLFVSMYVKDWSYQAGWVWTCVGMVWSLVAGAVTGIVYNMGGSKAAA